MRGAALRAWRRPPLAYASAAVRFTAPNARWSSIGSGTVGTPATADPRRTTFHFKLSQTDSTGAACAHQKYIEHPEACVSSFGTIADTQAERVRLWKEIGARSTGRAGSIRIRFEDDAETSRRVLGEIP